MSDQSKSKAQEDQLAAKKAAVLGQQKSKSSLPKVAAALVLALLAGAGLWWWMHPGMEQGRASGSLSPAKTVSAQEGLVVHAKAELADGKARFFSYREPGGLSVRYFLVQAQDGRIGAALDACDVCWRSGLGYEQQQRGMVCRNCGQVFPTSRVGLVRGGCNPSPLAVKVEGDRILVAENDLRQGRAYFDLKGAGPGGRS